jgi:hypothetical protein
MTPAVAVFARTAALMTAACGAIFVVGKVVEKTMSYRDATYVIFDGDEDKWAYGYMKGWNAHEHMNFVFRDAHELDTMTGRAQDEAYVKGKLKERMNRSSAVMVLVGEKTKNLYKYVRWELELALELGLPIIVVNLNEKRGMDPDRCPAIIKSACAVHIPFKLAAIKHALDKWPSEYRGLSGDQRGQGARHYNEGTYSLMGL